MWYQVVLLPEVSLYHQVTLIITAFFISSSFSQGPWKEVIARIIMQIEDERVTKRVLELWTELRLSDSYFSLLCYTLNLSYTLTNISCYAIALIRNTNVSLLQLESWTENHSSVCHKMISIAWLSLCCYFPS
jgi:hypothetical protein